MNIYSTIFISLALAMDAFAVSVVAGITQKELCVKNASLIALYFGFFQMIMPIIGWYAGGFLYDYIFPYQRIAAYLLLAIIGLKMIYEGNGTCEVSQKNYTCHKTLLLLAIATSIDALAVGLSYSITGHSIILPAIIIGLITFILSGLGVYLGKLTGCLFHDYAEMAGGIILIIIAFKILFTP